MAQAEKDASPDPAKKYESPEGLMQNAALTDQVKKMMLRQWQGDLLLLMTASDENMPSASTGPVHPASDSDNAERLRQVSNCLLRLEGEPVSAAENTNPAKPGARQ